MDEDKEFFEKQRETQEQHEKHRTFFEEDEDFFKKFDTEKEETKGGDSGDPTFFMAQEMSREEVIKEVKKMECSCRKLVEDMEMILKLFPLLLKTMQRLMLLQVSVCKQMNKLPTL